MFECIITKATSYKSKKKATYTVDNNSINQISVEGEEGRVEA